MTRKKIILAHLIGLFFGTVLLFYFSDDLMLIVYPEYGNEVLWLYTMLIGFLILLLVFFISLVLCIKKQYQRT